MLSDTFSLTIWLWRSLTWFIRHPLSPSISLTCSVWENYKRSLPIPEPVGSAYIQMYMCTTEFHWFDRSVQESAVEYGMFWNISYYGNGVAIPEQSNFWFNIIRTHRPSTSISIQLFHICNQLIKLIRVLASATGTVSLSLRILWSIVLPNLECTIG